MGIKYTKKEDYNEQHDLTVHSDDFMNLLVSTQRKEDKKKELPKTEKSK